MGVTLREKVVKLLEVSDIPMDERKALELVMTSVPEEPLEGLMFPEGQAHVEGRFEWYYRPNGELRRQAVDGPG